MTDPITNANSLNDASITANGQGQITGSVLHTVIAAVIGAIAALGGQAIIANPNGTTLPTGNSSVCVSPGGAVTLPAGATPNTVAYVSDCTQNVVAPQLLSSPETVKASTDATIAGAPSYQITLTGQGVGFRKTLAGPWQPF